MDFLTKIFGRSKPKHVLRQDFRSLPYMDFLNTFNNDNDFNNVYPAVSRIADAFLTLRPICINSRGEKIKHPILNALNQPNEDFSGVDFLNALAILSLVKKKFYLLVWQRKGRRVVPAISPSADNIAGFSFLEGVSVERRDGQKFYKLAGQEFHSGQVLEMFLNPDPDDLLAGFSPVDASRKWIDLDDYIAEYSKGLFKNGAVGSGQFVITARSVDEFNSIVRSIEATHHGVGKNNNVMFTHRPLDFESDKPYPPQIEWIPFSQTQQDLDLPSLFDQANKKLDANFGVPDEIKGYLQNSNYASVEVAEKVFIKYTLKPFATKLYARLTHELNRVTGGLGFCLSFELIVPEALEEKKTKVEILERTLAIIDKLQSQGKDLNTIVDALKLDPDFKKLRPSVQKTIKKKAFNLEDLKTHPEKFGIKTPAAASEVLRQVIEDYFYRLKGEDLTAGFQEVASQLMSSGFDDQVGKGRELLKDIEAEITAEGLSVEKVVNDYLAYLEPVLKDFKKDVKESITAGKKAGLTVGQIIGNSQYKIKRLTDSEAHRQDETARLEAMKQLEQKAKEQNPSLTIYKIWRANSLNPCPICKAQDGKRLPLDSPFIEKGVPFEDANGEIVVIDWEDKHLPNAHPNCFCHFEYEVEA